jgi:hypothetical protein
MTYEFYPTISTYGCHAIVYRPMERIRPGPECNESTRIWIFPDSNLDDD